MGTAFRAHAFWQFECWTTTGLCADEAWRSPVSPAGQLACRIFPEVAQKLCHPLYRIFGRVLGGAFLRGTQLLVRFQATEPGASPGKVHAAALEGLRSRIRRFLTRDDPARFSFDEVVRELKERRVSYTGEEVSQPVALTAGQISKSLPPKGHGGCIPVCNF